MPSYKQQYTERDIMDLEQKLMTDLNNFNSVYSCYLRSANNNNDNAKKILNPCTDSNATQSNVDTAKIAVNDDIAELKYALNHYSGKNQRQYNIQYNDIINQYNNIIHIRNDLDTKLAELYGTNSGVTNYYNNKYAATMFSKMMLTILLTSLAYYTFMKIIKK